MQPDTQITSIKHFDTSSNIVDIDTKSITRWKYKDRPENELDNLEELTSTLKSVEQQPCIVRPSQDQPDQYELVVGERRWRAAELANLKIKAVIKSLNDHEASLIQAIEHEKRTDLTDFSSGMSYAYKIEEGLLSQKD